jgi:hypothetical protein
MVEGPGLPMMTRDARINLSMGLHICGSKTAWSNIDALAQRRMEKQG